MEIRTNISMILNYRILIMGFILFFSHSCKEDEKLPKNQEETNEEIFDWVILPNKDQVALFIDQEVFSQLKTEIQQYKNDVEKLFPVQLNIVPKKWDTYEEIRSTIKILHKNNLVTGIVLVGAMPMHKFNMHDFANPNPLFFEAFDLNFVDTNNDGISDKYQGTPQLKVWVANIRAVEDPKKQGINELKHFFNKTHSYYGNQVNISQQALAVTGSDWADGANEFARKMQSLFDSTTVLAGKDASASSILKALNNCNYKMLYIQEHSTQSRHDLDDGSQISSDQIASIKNGALFMVNHGCSSTNWLKAYQEISRNMSMAYVFGEGIGQALVGQVRTGMVYGHLKMYDSILKGEYLGKAYMVAKEAAEKEMYNNYKDGSIVSGVVFIGNPFLYMRLAESNSDSGY